MSLCPTKYLPFNFIYSVFIRTNFLQNYLFCNWTFVISKFRPLQAKNYGFLEIQKWKYFTCRIIRLKWYSQMNNCTSLWRSSLPTKPLKFIRKVFIKKNVKNAKYWFLCYFVYVKYVALWLILFFIHLCPGKERSFILFFIFNFFCQSKSSFVLVLWK